MLFDNAKHHHPQVYSQSYADYTLRKESSILGIAPEALINEAKGDVQANEEHAQVRTNLNFVLGHIRVTQGSAVHADFFIPEGLFEKIEHHPMFT